MEVTLDENGNEWTDDAVPGGVEIAHVMLEILKDRGWDKTWSDCQGLQICPRVSVWLDGYQDLDYDRVFLLRVWTNSEPDADGWFATLTDHLAVYTHGDKPDVEWRQQPRLFFDADKEWSNEGLHWWVDWVDAVQQARWDAQKRPRALDALEAHNSKIIEGDRNKARTMGLASALPYLNKKEN